MQKNCVAVNIFEITQSGTFISTILPVPTTDDNIICKHQTSEIPVNPLLSDWPSP